MLCVCRQVVLDIFRQKMVPADRSGQRLSGEHPAVPIYVGLRADWQQFDKFGGRP